MFKFAVLTLLCLPAVVSTFECEIDGIFEKGCKSFIRCKDGVAETIECGEGYVFNEKIEDCDLIENVDGICGEYIDCSDKANGHYPDMSSFCQTYYTCHEGAFHGHNYCPQGLVYNEELGVCDWQQNTYEPCGLKPRPTEK
ncbi:hypothetical protein LOTGIDRAFT_239076 [Lottia gigantea]|uniref:Chitin-binding type-2 domain-containing protein n=1 Tax=Lottia gigantea TaxID=225164 RepID=V4A2T3_LOTGI|nr:hypothetical protein LOTGIDRAFT_239076 [Lottia gigantea]ESO98173.1 hypothetical protein LOTGIDRAFT_239076 [Lottia gigantea]